MPPLTITPKQEEILNAVARYVVSYGGAGSGKSVGTADRIIGEAYNGTDCLVVRKFATSIINSVWALIIHRLNESGVAYTTNKTERRIFVGQSGGHILFLGLDDPEKVKSLQGYRKCWIEEANELKQEDFRQLLLRLRGNVGGKIQYFLSFNPININHWLKHEFFDTPPDDCLIIHSTYKDNPFLDSQYIDELERLKIVDYYHYAVYALGEWGEIDNSLIFTNYKIHDFDEPSGTPYQGCDWGFNDPAALTKSYIKDGDLWIYNEYYERGKTNADLMRDWVTFRDYSIIADSSEPARIMEFRRAGYKIHGAQKGPGSIKAGIDYMRRFNCIHIHRTNCPNTGREFGLYKYKETKNGIIDEPLDLDNHACDSVRYALEPMWNRKRPEVNLTRRF